MIEEMSLKGMVVSIGAMTHSTHKLLIGFSVESCVPFLVCVQIGEPTGRVIAIRALVDPGATACPLAYDVR
jgi:hypothetical protein